MSEPHSKPGASPDHPPSASQAVEPVVHKHVEVSRRLVMVNAASSVLARLLNVFALVWVYQYLLARIPAEDFAIYPTVMTVMVFAPFFFSFFVGGVSRYIVSAYATDDKAGVEEIVSSIFPLLVLISAVFCTLGGLLAIFADVLLVLPSDRVDETRLMICLLVASFAVQMALLPFGVGFQVRQKFVELNLLWLARDTIRVVAIYALLTVERPDVVWIVVATVLADMLHLTAVTIRSRMLTPELRLRRQAFKWSVAKTLVSFGMWTTLGRLAAIMYINAGVIVLNRFGTAHDVTTFYFGAALFQQIQGMMTFARQPLQPSLIAMHTLADRARVARATARGGMYGLWVALFVACPLAVFSSDVVLLVMGPKYSDAATVIILLMMLFLFNQPAGLLPMLAVAMAEVRRFNLGAFVSTGVGLTLMIIVAGPLGLGAVGTAAALLFITAVVQVAYFWPLNLRLSGLAARTFIIHVLGRGLVPACVGGLVWVTAEAMLDTTAWLQLGVAVSIGGLAYIAVMVACLDKADLQLSRKLLRKMRGRAKEPTRPAPIATG